MGVLASKYIMINKTLKQDNSRVLGVESKIKEYLHWYGNFTDSSEIRQNTDRGSEIGNDSKINNDAISNPENQSKFGMSQDQISELKIKAEKEKTEVINDSFEDGKYSLDNDVNI